MSGRVAKAYSILAQRVFITCVEDLRQSGKYRNEVVLFLNSEWAETLAMLAGSEYLDEIRKLCAARKHGNTRLITTETLRKAIAECHGVKVSVAQKLGLTTTQCESLVFYRGLTSDVVREFERYFNCEYERNIVCLVAQNIRRGKTCEQVKSMIAERKIKTKGN